MYRAVAWAAANAGIPLDAEPRVAQLAAAATIHVSDDLVEINGHDVTGAIRTPDIDRGASAVARLPAVRAILVERQRALGAGGAIVMEGRDIGTVVFPAADVKVYLDAAPEERARRRAADPAHAGHATRLLLAEVAAELDARDRADTTRQSSPLMPAADAHVIDTTGLSIDEVTKTVLQIAGSRQ
jgi:cytidylate kinase